jgi:type IV secretion system protein VirB3
MSNPTLHCESDPVFLGLTRPPMFFGITDVYAVMMTVVVMVIFLGLGGMKGILYGLMCTPALYVFGYAMCENDARVFQLWGVKLGNFSMGRRRESYWGGVSFDPAGVPLSGPGSRRSVARKRAS